MPASGLMVDVLDAFGNLDKNDNSTVTLSVVSRPSPPNTTYMAPANVSATAVNGVATITPTFYTATTVFDPTSGGVTSELYLLKAFDTAEGITTGSNTNSEFVQIAASTPTSVQFVVQPTNSISGQPVPQFEVAIVDVFGNIVPVNGSPVLMSIFGGDNNESASSDNVAGTVNGIATFTGYILVNLNSPTPQSTTLDVLVSVSPLNLVISAQFMVT